MCIFHTWLDYHCRTAIAKCPLQARLFTAFDDCAGDSVTADTASDMAVAVTEAKTLTIRPRGVGERCAP